MLKVYPILAEDDEGAAQGGLWMQVRRGWLFLDLFILAAAVLVLSVSGCKEKERRCR